jgi:hypothetical protein
MQTASMMILTAEARVKASEVENKTTPILAPNAPKPDPILTFHARELQKKILDPENSYFKSTCALGVARAQSFIAAALDTKDPAHVETFKVFKDVYGLDEKKVEADFVQQACEEFGEHEFELEDPNYEMHAVALHKPTGAAASVVMMKIYDNFVNALKAKWAKQGYRGDAKFAKDYAATYGLTANTNIQDGFQLKK